MREGSAYLPGTNIPVLAGLDRLLVPIAFVRPDPTNPRTQVNLDALVESIRAFGMRWPVVVNRRTGAIEAGHQRVEALRRLGAQHVPVVWADDDMSMARAFMIADNRVGEVVAEWDEDALGALLADLSRDSDHLLDALGFDDAEITRLMMGDGPGSDGDEPEPRDEIKDQLQVKWDTHPGELWAIGPHRLLCGDSTNAESLRRVMGGRQANMIFTDPPYNVAYGNTMKDKLRGVHRPIENDNLGEDFRPFLLAAFQAMIPVCDGSIYVCMSSSELDALQSAFREAGGHWSTFLIWAKNTFTIGRSDYQRQYEPILYGWREGVSGRYWCGARDQGDVWEFDKPTRSEYHPTTKPIPLVERAIRNSSQPGDVVLDPFMGSGTSILAAHAAGRIGYGVELDPGYVAVILERCSEALGVVPMRIEAANG
jgi:DNA modification methylase